jgi:hypothetical protein
MRSCSISVSKGSFTINLWCCSEGYVKRGVGVDTLLATAVLHPAAGQVLEETQALKERQETPDPPEALTCIPCLHLSDIPKNITKVPSAVTDSKGATLLTHDLFTNDVLYAETVLDMRGVPGRLLPLIPLFCRSLTQVGAAQGNGGGKGGDSQGQSSASVAPQPRLAVLRGCVLCVAASTTA